MKYAILLFVSLLAQTVLAGPMCEQETVVIDTKVPKFLEGATITVTTADGRTTTMKSEEFKVVPRKQQIITAKKVCPTCVSTEVVKEVTLVVREEPRKNRVSILGGYGTVNGIKSSVSPTQVEVESQMGAVGGVQYQRLLSEKFSIGVQGQTNRTGLLMLGLDF